MHASEELEFPKLKKAAPDSMPTDWYVAEEKLDGESIIIWGGHAYGRRVSTVTHKRENKWEQMPPWVQKQYGDPTLKVHGELHVEGGTSSDVKKALVEGRETNWAGDLCKRLRFTAYRVVDSTCKSASWHRIYLTNRGFRTPRVLLRPSMGPLFLAAGIMEYAPNDFTFNELMKVARDNRIEGFVLKESKGLWWKLKVTWTYDCVVTGTKDGTGMNYGDVGALIVSMFGFDGEPVEVASVGGMTENERLWMTQNRKTLIGRVCEVEANGVCTQGRLHHPRFIRWREDKNPTDCTLDQIGERQ